MATNNEVDFVAHGSPEHAALLGLKKASQGDEPAIDGWTLVDTTAWGPQATPAYLREILRQKVAELKAGSPPTPQSKDPRKPNFAPAMWRPPQKQAAT